MRAIYYDKVKEFELRDIPKPQPRPDEVLVKIDCCGICKTDVHQHSGKFIVNFPLIPGHEMAGTVEAVGADVTRLKVGDRVTVDDTGTCGHCDYCRSGQPLFCENFESKGATQPGAFAEYVTAAADHTYKLADHVSFEQGSFSEPTACAMHGMDMIDPQPGDHVLLFGAGPTGMILAQLLNHSNAFSVTVAAPSRDKLDILNEYGVKDTVQIKRDDVETTRARLLRDNPNGFDIVVDATGSAKVAEDGLTYLKKGGKLVLYSVYDDADRMSISPYTMFERQLTIVGSFAQNACFARAVDAINKGIVKTDKLITHVMPLEDFGKGLALAAKGGPGVIKILVKP